MVHSALTAAPPATVANLVSVPSWLRTGLNAPAGGIPVAASYVSGTRTSIAYLSDLDAVLSTVFDKRLFPGSFNLLADTAVSLPDPMRARVLGADWILAPVVVGETVVGVAARTAASDPGRSVEVFAPWSIAEVLGVEPGARLMLRLLEGSLLQTAA